MEKLGINGPLLGLQILHFVLLLVLLSVLLGRLAVRTTSNRHRAAGWCLAGVSLFPLSQLWLHSVLAEGFMPGVLAAATLVAMWTEFTDQRGTIAGTIFASLTGIVMLALTYPLLLVFAGAGSVVALVQRVAQRRGQRLGIGPVAAIAATLSIAVAAFMQLGPVRAALVDRLDVSGRISPISAWAMPTLLVLGLGVWVLASPSGSSSILPLSVAIVVGLVFELGLARLLESPYYVDKTRWLTSTIGIALLAASAVRLIGDRRRYRTGGALAILGFLAVLAQLPILQHVPKRPVPISVLQQWALPSVSEAQIVLEANDRFAESIFWRPSPDPLTTRVMDIWATAALRPTTSNLEWAYLQDVQSIVEVCAFARRNAPMVIWVASDAAAEVASAACPGVDVRVSPDP